MTSVLVVDDSISMRMMLADTLKQAWYAVVEASDGRDALAAAQRSRVNLVVTDVNMPNMDGIELARALRALPDYRSTPILMLTTESGLDKKQQGKVAGATGWIVKPFNPDTLLAAIGKVMEQAS